MSGQLETGANAEAQEKLINGIMFDMGTKVGGHRIAVTRPLEVACSAEEASIQQTKSAMQSS